VLAFALILLVLALELGATLLVALCDSFSRQGKLLRVLLIVAVPIVGALVALRMVYVAPGSPAQSAAPALTLDVQNAVINATIEAAKDLDFHVDGH
jgi:hypothetical protein